MVLADAHDYRDRRTAAEVHLALRGDVADGDGRDDPRRAAVGVDGADGVIGAGRDDGTGDEGRVAFDPRFEVMARQSRTPTVPAPAGAGGVTDSTRERQGDPRCQQKKKPTLHVPSGWRSASNGVRETYGSTSVLTPSVM